MTGEPSTISLVVLLLYMAVSGGSAIWVFWDTRRRGRPLSESIAWVLFMIAMFPLAITTYIFFLRKKLI